ncbi:Uncharacterised protein [Mycobacteroides abscessus]|nr:Uncharacterised protein [Mycobacteroides abscessus]
MRATVRWVSAPTVYPALRVISSASASISG